VTPVNDAPTSLTLSASNINENLATGSVVGQFSTVDPDTGQTHTYTLVDGIGSDDNASFTIDGNALKTNASFDYESKSSYSIRVQTNDANEGVLEKVLTVNVNDVNETPPSTSTPVIYTPPPSSPPPSPPADIITVSDAALSSNDTSQTTNTGSTTTTTTTDVSVSNTEPTSSKTLTVEIMTMVVKTEVKSETTETQTTVTSEVKNTTPVESANTGTTTSTETTGTDSQTKTETTKAADSGQIKTDSTQTATLVGAQVQVAFVNTGAHTMIVVYNPAAAVAAAGAFVGTTTQVDLGTAQTMSVGSFTKYLAETAKSAVMSSEGFRAFELPPGITVNDVKRACNTCTQNN
jgi:hypothetical protein